MWTCPLCHQSFRNTNQQHACHDTVLNDFLEGKNKQVISLFWHFIRTYNSIGDIGIHPAKTMIGISAGRRIAWVTRLGKDSVDIVFPFREAYPDNLCFHRIAKVPGSAQHNHHFRMMQEDDINDEVLSFMRLAWEKGQPS